MKLHITVTNLTTVILRLKVNNIKYIGYQLMSDRQRERERDEERCGGV